MLLLEDNREKGLLEEFARASILEDYHRVMGISMFVNRRTLWMRRVCHYYMRNTKDQGFAQINWAGLSIAKKRR